MTGRINAGIALMMSLDAVYLDGFALSVVVLPAALAVHARWIGVDQNSY